MKMKLHALTAIAVLLSTVTIAFAQEKLGGLLDGLLKETGKAADEIGSELEGFDKVLDDGIDNVKDTLEKEMGGKAVEAEKAVDALQKNVESELDEVLDSVADKQDDIAKALKEALGDKALEGAVGDVIGDLEELSDELEGFGDKLKATD